jgi:membrane protein
MRRFLGRQFRHLYHAWDRYEVDDGPLMAAAVSYYMGLALFPLLFLLTAGLGLFLKHTHLGQDAEQQILAAISEHLSPSVGKQVRAMLGQIQSRAAINGPIGLATMLLAALAAFAQFERAFDRIWRVPRKDVSGIWATAKRLLIERGTAFLSLMTLGLFLIVIFISGVVLSAIQTTTSELAPLPGYLWTGPQLATSMALNALLFTAIYRWLPKAPVKWREAAQGAVVAAILWEIGRQVLAAVLIGAWYSAYGIIGSFLMVLLWCYYAVTVVFLGAEYVQEICENCQQAPWLRVLSGRSPASATDAESRAKPRG